MARRSLGTQRRRHSELTRGTANRSSSCQRKAEPVAVRVEFAANTKGTSSAPWTSGRRRALRKASSTASTSYPPTHERMSSVPKCNGCLRVHSSLSGSSTCTTRQTKDLHHGDVALSCLFRLGFTHADAVFPGKRVVLCIDASNNCRLACAGLFLCVETLVPKWIISSTRR